MRAHLLQPTYIHNERDDAQLDCASNDACFDSAQADAPKRGRKPACVTFAAAWQPATRGIDCDNDDYWLGGYAGI